MIAFMLLAASAMLKDIGQILDDWGFGESRQGIKAEYVIERAFCLASDSVY